MNGLSVRTLLDVTDDLLLTEQPIPRWVAVAWSDALGTAPTPRPGGELAEEVEDSP